MSLTIVSTKGQVILPKSVRDQLHWGPGTRLVVEQTADGVLLKAKPQLPPARHEDVFGCPPTHKPPKTIEDMAAAIGDAVKVRHDRGRY